MLKIVVTDISDGKLSIAQNKTGKKLQIAIEGEVNQRPLDLLRVWHVKLEAWMLEQAGVEFKPAEREKPDLLIRDWKNSSRLAAGQRRQEGGIRNLQKALILDTARFRTRKKIPLFKSIKSAKRTGKPYSARLLAVLKPT